MCVSYWVGILNMGIMEIRATASVTQPPRISVNRRSKRTTHQRFQENKTSKMINKNTIGMSNKSGNKSLGIDQEYYTLGS